MGRWLLQLTVKFLAFLQLTVNLTKTLLSVLKYCYSKVSKQYTSVCNRCPYKTQQLEVWGVKNCHVRGMKCIYLPVKSSLLTECYRLL